MLGEVVEVSTAQMRLCDSPRIRIGRAIVCAFAAQKILDEGRLP